LEELGEPLNEIEAKFGESGPQEDKDGEVGQMKQQIIVLEQRIEESETMIMAQVHRDQADTFVSEQELMVSLVSHVDGLKGNLEELRSNDNWLKGNVERLKGNWEGLACLKKELRCIKCEVKTLKKRRPEPPAAQERDVTLEPTELADLREEVGQLREQLQTMNISFKRNLNARKRIIFATICHVLLEKEKQMVLSVERKDTVDRE
jgi:hypothetical protein